LGAAGVAYIHGRPTLDTLSSEDSTVLGNPSYGIAAFLTAVTVLAASDEARSEFVSVGPASGIDFRPTFGDDRMSSIVEATGFGCALLDYDGDGYLDVYFANGRHLAGISDTTESRRPATNAANVLYRNNGDGSFTDVSAESGTADTGFGMGVAAADFDGDGDPDLYVTNYRRNTLLINNGDGTFSDATERAGVGDTLWSVGVTALDFDRDGWLDIYVGNYLDFDPGYRLYYAADEFPGPLSYPGVPDRLYRNNGDGTFSDATEASGIVSIGRAMGVIAADVDADGCIDVFAANDAMENHLYRSACDGTFDEIALRAGVAFSESGNATSSMGGDFGDFDNDGDFDLLVPDMGYKSLYRNDGNGRFRDVSFSSGLAVASGQYVSWGGIFLDYDHDGWLDILLANGDAHRLATQEDLILKNVPAPDAGGRRFVDAWRDAGRYFREKGVARGMAAGDLDNDGDLDVVVVRLDKPAAILRNDIDDGTHWLMVELVGTRSNREGVGATVTARAGGLTLARQRMVGNNYLSTNDPRLHFGLGEHTEIDEITVRWPSGIVQQLNNVAVDQTITITEPKSPDR